MCVPPGATVEERRALVERALATQEFAITVRAVSRSDEQHGPVRLLTFSSGPFERNVALGLEGTSLVIRIRTPMTGENGHVSELWVPDAIRAGTPTDIRVSYDRSSTIVALQSDHLRTESFRFDALSHGILLHGTGRITPAQVSGSRRFGLAVLLLPVVIAAASGMGLIWERRSRHAEIVS